MYFSQELSKSYINNENNENKEDDTIQRKNSQSSIKEIINNPNSRNQKKIVNNSNNKKSFDKNFLEINLYKIKNNDKNLKHVSTTSLNNSLRSIKIRRTVDKGSNNNLTTTQSTFFNTKEPTKFKNLKLSFDYNHNYHKSIPLTSTNISLADYYDKNYLIPNQQSNNKVLSSVSTIGNFNYLFNNNLKGFHNKDLPKKEETQKIKDGKSVLIKSDGCNINNSLVSNINSKKSSIKKEKPVLKSINSVIDFNKATNENIKSSTNSIKILNNKLINFLAKNKKNVIKKVKSSLIPHKNNLLKSRINLFEKNKFNTINHSKNKNIFPLKNIVKNLSISNRNMNDLSNISIINNLKNITNHAHHPTEISIDLNDLCDPKFFLSEFENIQNTKNKIKTINIDKLIDDYQINNELIESPSITNLNKDSNKNNTFKLNIGSKLEIIKYKSQNFDNNQNVRNNGHSNDFLKEIRLNIDDNLKNLFNFSYEHSCFKDKENSELVSFSDEEKHDNKIKNNNDSRLNTEEFHNNQNQTKVIMFTNQISFEEADEKLKNIIFKKK